MLSSIAGFFRKAPAAATRAVPTRKNSVFMPLVWIDCEMTGLNVEKDHIIEICCIITDGDLNVVDQNGYESTVYVSKRFLIIWESGVLTSMVSWVSQQRFWPTPANVTEGPR